MCIRDRLWGWLSDLANGRRALVACIALALIIATLGVYQHASNQYVYLTVSYTHLSVALLTITSRAEMLNPP